MESTEISTTDATQAASSIKLLAIRPHIFIGRVAIAGIVYRSLFSDFAWFCFVSGKQKFYSLSGMRCVPHVNGGKKSAVKVRAEELYKNPPTVCSPIKYKRNLNISARIYGRGCTCDLFKGIPRRERKSWQPLIERNCTLRIIRAQFQFQRLSPFVWPLEFGALYSVHFIVLWWCDMCATNERLSFPARYERRS